MKIRMRKLIIKIEIIDLLIEGGNSNLNSLR